MGEDTKQVEVIESKQDRLVRNIHKFKSIGAAAIDAGYSESTAKGRIYDIIKTPKFQKALREHYLTSNATLLPKILKAESDLMDVILLDPEKLSKHNNTVKQMKQAAGILEPDNQPRQQVINIKSIKELSIHLQQKRIEQAEPVQDAEVIDIKA